MQVFLSALINLQSNLLNYLKFMMQSLVRFTYQLICGEKSFSLAFASLLVFYLVINWSLILGCSILTQYDDSLTITRGDFYLMQAPFFCFACYILWIHTKNIDSKFGRFLVKTAVIIYCYITAGSIFVSLDLFEGLPNQKQLHETLVFPLKVDKNADTRVALHYTESLN
ncbi:MAG: hypothetical protein VX112_01500 [Pseudomonadota bacterium]|nr:hypothetical protein [Pseudomonadota bacterium]